MQCSSCFSLSPCLLLLLGFPLLSLTHTLSLRTKSNTSTNSHAFLDSIPLSAPFMQKPYPLHIPLISSKPLSASHSSLLIFFFFSFWNLIFRAAFLELGSESFDFFLTLIAMISSGLNLVMTVIGFAVSTMFIVFVCTRLVCARIHLNASRRSFPIASRSNLSMMERGWHGLERTAVAKFPTKKFSDKLFSAEENSQCTVCLSEYQGEDILRILPYCGHSFHVTCIDLWLQQNSTCPVCRISLREFTERKRLMQPLFSSALRPHRSAESIENPHYLCMMGDNGLPLRTPDNHGANVMQEDSFPSEGGGADATDSITCLIPDDLVKDEEKKHIESPSNF